MILADPPYNPMPEGAVAGTVKTSDNQEIRYAHWRASGYPIQGTVLLLHGRAEYIEKTYETVSALRAGGFGVLTFDWRGQGGSSRLLENERAGYVDDFDQYTLDLDAIVHQVALPDCVSPLYILAHSTGALISLLAAPAFTNRIRRMVLCAPFLGFAKMPVSQQAVKLISGMLCAFGLGEVYLSGGATPDENRPFIGNKLTTDTKRFERNQKFVEEYRSLSIGGPTAAWVFAACRAMDRVNDPDFHNQINIPTLLVSAGSDDVVSNMAIEELGRRLRSGSTLTIPGAKHELMQERNLYREQLLAAFFSFVPGSEMAA